MASLTLAAACMFLLVAACLADDLSRGVYGAPARCGARVDRGRFPETMAEQLPFGNVIDLLPTPCLMS